jgi:hypothetical protein
LGICVFGFDKSGGRTQGFEVYWSMLDRNELPHISRLVQDPDYVRITHSGTGTHFVTSVINHPNGRYNPIRLIGASLLEVQKYVREVYKNAFKLQPMDSRVFGGDYNEVTILFKGMENTTPSI